MTSPKVSDALRWKRMEKIWARASKLRRIERDAFIEREAKNEQDRQLLLDRSQIEDSGAPWRDLRE